MICEMPVNEIEQYMTSIVVAPSPMKTPHLKPRRAPSLRMVRLMGPGSEEKNTAQTKPANAATKIGCVSAMSVSSLRLVLVLLDFPAPRARNVRAHKTIEQIGRE